MMVTVNAALRSTDLDATAAVDAFAAAADRFSTSVLWSDLRAPVVTCSGWSAYDLVVHLGNVHAWAATIVETGQEAVEQNDEPRTSTKPKIVSEWYRGKAEDLFEVLRQTPPDTPAWNFVDGRGTAAFWSRRQLHETTMHQVDLDHTRGHTTEIDADVAVDGVTEVLTVMLQRMQQRGHPTALDEPLALVAGDTGDTWVVAPRNPSRQVAPRSGSSRVVPLQPVASTDDSVLSLPPVVKHHHDGPVPVENFVESSAAVLYRLLWQRPVNHQELHLGGDQARVRAFLRSRLTP
jgi:uncharacterized protein (TIGR03083 family)